MVLADPQQSLPDDHSHGHSHHEEVPPAAVNDDVTRFISQIEQRDGHGAEQLLPLIYDELRKLAAQKLAEEQPGQTLQATALVHEAYLRLVNAQDGRGWDNRRHFFAAAAEAMRRILVENARARIAAGASAVRTSRICTPTC